MRLDELFRAPSFSADEVRLRMKNSKSPEEKAKWAELLPKEELSEEALKPYLDRLVSKEGIQRLGGGAFSQVFQHPHYGNVVVKVYTDKDVVYKKYAAWCMKHQNNPYVPKIIEQVAYKSPETKEKYNIIFLQKMTPVKTAGKLAILLGAALGLSQADDNDFFKEFGQFNTTKQDFRMIEKYMKLGKADSDFVQVWDHIRTYGVAKFDLHYENVMLRDGHLVLTDPVAIEPGSQRVDDL
jgi:hypothetical protein